MEAVQGLDKMNTANGICNAITHQVDLLGKELKLCDPLDSETENDSESKTDKKNETTEL
jgi:hypothetical protein